MSGNYSFQHNLGAYLAGLGSGGGEAVAAGAGDDTEVDGAWADRLVAGYGRAGLLLVIFYKAVLGEDETLSFAANVQDATSAAGAGAADYGTALAAAVVATGPAGGGTVEGVVFLDVDAEAARQFVRAQVTPDLSASATDTVHWAAGFLVPRRNIGTS